RTHQRRDDDGCRGLQMDLDQARKAKHEAASYARELVTRSVRARGLEGQTHRGLSLGLAPQPDGSYPLAVRYRLGVPTARMVARRVVEQAGPAVDVRRTGRIRAVQRTAEADLGAGGTDAASAGGTDAASAGAATPGPGSGHDVTRRPPVITALALGE